LIIDYLAKVIAEYINLSDLHAMIDDGLKIIDVLV